MSHHFVGDVDADDLPEALRAFGDEAGQQARGPARSAAEIENALAGSESHATHGFLGDVEVMVLHLRAFALLGPAVEFVLEALVGRDGGS